MKGPFGGSLGVKNFQVCRLKNQCPFPNYRNGAGWKMLPGCQPGWKLAYAGSVGGQALVGIAGLQKFRRQGHRFSIWPFEDPAEAPVVVAEMYPSHWPLQVCDYDVKDANQVVQVAREVTADRMTHWLDRSRLPSAALIEEGWVLGVEPET